jgi:putative ABC transport system permease protein
MTALNRKLLRDIWHHRGPMLSIAAVVAVGVMTVLTMRGTYESLVDARDRYYRTARFPDAWVRVERAPETLTRRLAEIPGVAAVDTRVTLSAMLDVPGLDAPAFGLFVSIPDTRRSMLGDIHLRSGQYIAADRPDDVLVSVKFAAANDLSPGDTLRAVINGRLRELHITGTAITPEHTYAVPPGAIFPEDERYGIVWMGRTALAAAYDMDGAFNEALLALAPGARPGQVHTLVDRVLKPYGGLGTYGREDQVSAQILEGELEQNRSMGTAVPAMFLAVAAFLLNIVLGRRIATQRTVVGVL